MWLGFERAARLLRRRRMVVDPNDCAMFLAEAERNPYGASGAAARRRAAGMSDLYDILTKTVEDA